MANQFPTTLPIDADGFGDEWIDDIKPRRYLDGTLKPIALQPSKKREITVTGLWTTAQKTTFEAFYDANRLGPAFNFQDNAHGTNPLCYFISAPKWRYVSAASGSLWAVSFTLGLA